MDRKALLFALATAVTICLYTISDGKGARVSGDAAAYIVALFIFDGLVFTAFAAWRRGIAGLRPILGFVDRGLREGRCRSAPTASRSGR